MDGVSEATNTTKTFGTGVFFAAMTTEFAQNAVKFKGMRKLPVMKSATLKATANARAGGFMFHDFLALMSTTLRRRDTKLLTPYKPMGTDVPSSQR